MLSANEQGGFRDCCVATYHIIAASPEASCLSQEEQSSRLGPQCGGSKDGRKERLSRVRCTLTINSRCAGRGGESCGEGDIANDDDKEVLRSAPTLEVVSAAAAHTSQAAAAVGIRRRIWGLQTIFRSCFCFRRSSSSKMIIFGSTFPIVRKKLSRYVRKLTKRGDPQNNSCNSMNRISCRPVRRHFVNED